MKMYINGTKKVDRYVDEIFRKFRRGNVLEELVRSSNFHSLEEVKKAMPSFVNAMVKYIEYAEKQARKGIRPVQFGLVVESSEERKEVNRTFTIDNDLKKRLFYPQWDMTAHEDFMYRLLEAYFDATLITEQGAIRKFKEFVELYRGLIPAYELGNCYFGIYKTSVILVNLDNGCIHKLKPKAIDNKNKKKGIKCIEYDDTRNEYYLILNDNESKYVLTRNGETTTIMEPCDKLKDKKKEYYQVTLVSRNPLHNTPAVQFSAHSIILLAKFGINAAKHCLNNSGLLTCHHVDEVGNNNNPNNLEIVTRKDNYLITKGKDPIIQQAVSSYDLSYYFTHINQCYGMDKSEIDFKMFYQDDFWSEKLIVKPAREYVWCA